VTSPPTTVPPPPFLADILEERSATLYALCDDPLRVRDPMAVVTLIRYFAEQGVHLDLVPVLADQRRYVSPQQMEMAFDTPEAKEELRKRWAAAKDIRQQIQDLFEVVENQRHADLQMRVGRLPRLVPRGPVIVLARPALYPPEFMLQIEEELSRSRRHVVGRFRMPEAQSLDNEQFWQLEDRDYGISYPKERNNDHAVVRKVCGEVRRRSFLFASGTTSTGTYGAAQFVIDRDLTERYAGLGIERHYREHGEVEILLSTKPRAAPGSSTFQVLEVGWRDWEPDELKVIAGPSEQVSKAARDWIQRLMALPPCTDGLYVEPQELPAEFEHLYTLAGGRDGATCLEVAGIHPSGNHTWQMVGGTLVAAFVKELQNLASADSRAPILLHGPTGAGKELAARLIYQALAYRLLSWHRTGEGHPLVAGAGFTTANCASLPQTLDESLLFGFVWGAASDMTPRPGHILAAGEGVVLLDELSLMPLHQQNKLLRVTEPPNEVNPVGAMFAVPSSARIVCAMSDDPDDLVREGRMHRALANRLKAGRIRIPSLADRPGDIPALLAYFAGRPVRIDAHALRHLLGHAHPDNVRGLRNLVQRCSQADRSKGKAPDAPLLITPDVLAEHGYMSPSLTDPLPRDGKDGAVRVFEFTCPHTALANDSAFTDAVRALTSLVLDANGNLAVRPVDERPCPNEPPREISQERGNQDGSKGLSRKWTIRRSLGANGFTLNFPEECADLWVQAVQRLACGTDERIRKRRLEALKAFAKRSPVSAVFAHSLKRPWNARGHGRDKHPGKPVDFPAAYLAESIGVSASIYSRKHKVQTDQGDGSDDDGAGGVDGSAAT
jgi:hypothetical protein